MSRYVFIVYTMISSLAVKQEQINEYKQQKYYLQFSSLAVYALVKFDKIFITIKPIEIDGELDESEKQCAAWHQWKWIKLAFNRSSASFIIHLLPFGRSFNLIETSDVTVKLRF